MSVQPYRDVLSRPGVRSLLLVCLLARMPITAAPLALTLHVVLNLHRGFAQAGLIAAMTAIGAALGSPLLGSAMDRFGLRPILVLTTIAEGCFWLSAAHLSYLALIPASFGSGLLALPAFTLARQSLAALLPPAERQAGFSLDSMGVEISFAVGPALGVVAITQTSADVTFAILAGLLVASGLALLRLNPPVHGEDGVAAEPGAARAPSADRPSLRQWFNARVLAIMLATFGATFVLVGTDTAFTAAMRSFDEVPLLGVVTAVWCIASLVGGFAYGLMKRRIDPLVLLALLAGFTIPIGLAGTWWHLALLAIPTGIFCAPLLSSGAEALTRVTPATVRGQVMGVHASALTIGNAAGAPLVGLIVDHFGHRWGFVGIGLCGLGLALAGLAAQTRNDQSRARQPRPDDARSDRGVAIGAEGVSR